MFATKSKTLRTLGYQWWRKILKARMMKQYNIVHHSLYENDGINQDWALDTSSIIIRDTDSHPV